MGEKRRVARYFYSFVGAVWLAVYAASVFLQAFAISGSRVKHSSSVQPFWHNFWSTYNFAGEPPSLQPDPALVQHWRLLCPRDSPQIRSVLVPLCGTGDDLELLAELCEAADVVGVEIETTPIAVFFKRLLQLDLLTSSNYFRFRQTRGPLTVYGAAKERGDSWHPIISADNITLSERHRQQRVCVVARDFFAADPTHFEQSLLPREFDAVVDIRAFVAVPPGDWYRYIAQLHKLTHPGTRMLIVLLHAPDWRPALIQLAEEDVEVEESGSAPIERCIAPFARSVEAPSLPPFALASSSELNTLFGATWRYRRVGRPRCTRHGLEQAYLMVRR